MSEAALPPFIARRRSVHSERSKVRPDWMDSQFEDNIWLLRAPFNHRPYYQLNFAFHFPDGSNLSASSNDHLRQTLKELIWEMRQGANSHVTSPEVTYYTFMRTITLFEWMKLNSIQRICEITQADFDQFCERARFGSCVLLDIESRIKAFAIKTKGIVPLWKPRGSPDYGAIAKASNIDQERLRTSRVVRAFTDHLLEFNGWNSRKLSLAEIRSWTFEHRPIVHGHLEHILEPLWLLHKHQGRVTQDRLSDDFGTIGRIPKYAFAKKLALKRTQRTKNIPLQMGMFILDRAIRWVVDYADHLLDQRDHLLKQFDKYDGKWRGSNLQRKKAIEHFAQWNPIKAPSSPWPIYPTLQVRHGGDENSFNEKGFITSIGHCLETLLPSACFIVIAAFTARRRNEILRLRHGCLRDKPQGRCIEFYIEKTIRDWDDNIPCPPIVERAVKVLERLSKSARAVSGDDRLFQQVRTNSASESIMQFDAGRIKEFAKFISIPNEIGDLKKFDPTSELSPHQFRRFFSILFVWQYKFGTLAALKQQLRHTNIEMTRVYVSQLHRGDIYGELTKEVNYKLLSQVALGESVFSGDFVERFQSEIKDLLAEYRKSLSVLHKKQAISRLKRHIDETGVKVLPLPWGICSANPESPASLKSAKCLSGDLKNSVPGIGINLDLAAPSVCKACSHCSYNTLFNVEDIEK